MPFMATTSAFVLGRRQQSLLQRYLHRLHTIHSNKKPENTQRNQAYDIISNNVSDKIQLLKLYFYSSIL